MAKEIGLYKDLLEAHDFKTPELFYELLNPLSLSNFSKCALDLAAWDLFGKLNNMPLYKFWNTNLQNLATTNYTIGIDSVEKMVAKMVEKPWPIYKVKLGTSQDIAIVKALRAKTNAVFRIDANCAWEADETISNARILKDLGVEFIEQPLAADQWEEMKKVFETSCLPLIADESCLVPEDVAKCVGHFHGINIKLTK